MTKPRPWVVGGLVLAAGLLENGSLANLGPGLWLGPALLIAISPILGWSHLVYWLSALAGTGLWTLSHPLTTAWLIPLHFALAFLAWRKPRLPWAIVAAIAPVIGFGLYVKLEWGYLAAATISVALQLLLGIGLKFQIGQRLQELRQQANQRRMAHGVALAGSVESQLAKLTGVTQEVEAGTERIYTLYQDLELLTRGNPSIPETLATNLLEVAKENHQAKLRLAMLQASLQDNLRFLAGKQGATLGELCGWAAAKLSADADQLNRQVVCQVEISDDPLVELGKQLALAFLLQSICQQELRALNADEVIVNFTGYAAKGKLRVVVTMRKKTERAGDEWPALRPMLAGQLADFATRMSIQCKMGVGTNGQRVITLEFD